MKNRSVILLMTFLLMACANSENAQLNMALKMSGENRQELEQVLDHYANEPEKLRMAKFLIMNMPGHYSLDYPGREEFVKNVDEYYADKPYYVRKLIYNLPPYHGASYYGVYDITTLKAEFLIYHIDFWCRQRAEQPWIGEIADDIFYQYLLPYRQNNELIDTEFYEFARQRNDSMKILSQDYEWIKNKLINHLEIVDEHILPIEKAIIADSVYLPPPFDKKVKLSCIEIASFYNFLYRAHHVPSAMDRVNYWGHFNDGHAWCAVITGLQRQHTHGSFTNTLTPKVYRTTYAHNPTFLDKNERPEVFRTPFNRDVTNEYIYVSDANVKAERIKGVMYLAVHNNRGLKEMAIAPIKFGRAKFRDLGKMIMYFPVVYDGHIQKPTGYPFFITTDNEKVAFKPDKENLTDITIRRKYHFDYAKIGWAENLLGTTVEVASDRNFKDAETVHTFKDRDIGLSTVNIDIKPDRPVRYIRITPKKDSLFLAEISTIKKDGIPHNSYRDTISFSKLFDGDILTYSLMKKALVVDLGEISLLESLLITPRTDDNGIVPGEDYELFYYDKGWVSLGRRIADSNELVYKDVPSNAVYWLTNYTKGREERPFTVDSEGLQRYW